MISVLIIIPYENLYPPRNGGMLRTFNILCQLAKHFSVTAIIHQKEETFEPAKKEFPELSGCRIVSVVNHPLEHDLFSLFPKKLGNALRYRWWRRSWKGSTDSHFLKYYTALHKVLKSNRFDIALLENLATVNVAPVIRRISPGTTIIYDAHNVDSAIAPPVHYKQMLHFESSLYTQVDALLACSRKDFEELIRLNKGKIGGEIIPNGVTVDPDVKTTSIGPVENLIFCGSLDYEPNREGLSWFCLKVLPEIRNVLPGLKLIVVGKGTPGPGLAKLLEHPAIDFSGEVSDVKEYYKKSGIAVVPLLSGSGTRLKVLEAMSLGIPVVATSKGAEGIIYTQELNIKIANNEAGFAEAVICLVKDRELASKMAKEAYNLVKAQYDWNLIGFRLKNFINSRHLDKQAILKGVYNSQIKIG